MWDVYVVHKDGFREQINSSPYSLRDLERFLLYLGDEIEITSIILLPLGFAVEGSHCVSLD